MSDDEKKKIKGTNGDDHINPDGYGLIKTGKGNDIVVISEGDFFDISGFEGTDLPMVSKADIRKQNSWREFFDYEKLDVGQDDKLLMFLDPEKELTQSVQYFIRGGSTYVQIYDNELNKVVAGARIEGTEFEIEVVGENGNLGVSAIELRDNKSNNQFANDINDMISKGEIDRDNTWGEMLDNYANKKADEGKTSWNPFDRLASKFYESQKDREK